MDGLRLTDSQIKLFCDMMHKAFEEIRNLAWVGLPEQAGALADAFHNLPIYLVSPNFDWDVTRLFIEGYQKRYPRIVENNVVSGSYYDYLAMFEDIRRIDHIES